MGTRKGRLGHLRVLRSRGHDLPRGRIPGSATGSLRADALLPPLRASPRRPSLLEGGLRRAGQLRRGPDLLRVRAAWRGKRGLPAPGLGRRAVSHSFKVQLLERGPQGRNGSRRGFRSGAANPAQGPSAPQHLPLALGLRVPKSGCQGGRARELAGNTEQERSFLTSIDSIGALCRPCARACPPWTPLACFRLDREFDRAKVPTQLRPDDSDDQGLEKRADADKPVNLEQSKANASKNPSHWRLCCCSWARPA